MPVSQQVEHVLVVPTAVFYEIGHFQGLCTEIGPYIESLFDPAYTSYRPRNEVEGDPGFKQLIPYCLFRCEGKTFHYTRGNGQGEQRLHAKRSIGVGGHISQTDDSGGTAGVGAAYDTGMQREIEEEVILGSEFVERCVGLINDDETDVGRVHLGIVHIFDLLSPKVLPRESSMISTGFASSLELVRDRDQFETWSQICIDHLFG